MSLREPLTDPLADLASSFRISAPNRAYMAHGFGTNPLFRDFGQAIGSVDGIHNTLSIHPLLEPGQTVTICDNVPPRGRSAGVTTSSLPGSAITLPDTFTCIETAVSW